MTRRVVITGLGTVNPLATDVKSYWQGLLAGRRVFGRLLVFRRADVEAFEKPKKSGRPRKATATESGGKKKRKPGRPKKKAK